MKLGLPKHLYFGRGTVEKITNHICKDDKVLVVTGRSSTYKLFEQYLKPVLERVGVEYKVFNDVSPDPRLHELRKGVEFAREFNPNVIIGFGGGSPIDTAKAIWIFTEYSNFDFDEKIREFWSKPFSVPRLHKILMIAIETTSGTGTAVSRGCVVTDETGFKRAIVSHEIIPHVAIYDPNLTDTMPKKVIADSGMDALSHALEAYASPIDIDIANEWALEAIKIINEWLPKSYSNPRNKEAKDKMHYANMLAGLAFTQMGVGIIHTISHAISHRIGLTHGRTNAILMPYVVDYNATAVESKYAGIARKLGVYTATVEDSVKALIKRLLKLNKLLGIPTKLKDVVDRKTLEKYEEDVEKAYIATNPREPTPEELKQVLWNAYEGKLTFYIEKSVDEL